MKKDLMLIRVPFILATDVSEIAETFKQRFDKWYHVIVVTGQVHEIKVELVSPSLWNYIKYKFRSILNYGK